MSGENPREIAVQVLLHRTRAGADFVEQILEKALAGANLAPADRSLARELVFGVVRWEAALDWLIAQKTPRQAPSPRLQNLLRLGLYQIFWLERIPAHAAVHETVESAKRNGLGAKAGFVNAVLRGFLRESGPTRQRLSGLKTAQPHLGYSHPEWLVLRWRERWGMEKTSQLLEWNNTPPALFARANTLKTDPGKLLERWRGEGVEYDFVRRDWLEENLVFELKSHPPLADMPSFQDGWFYVQDPSTLLAVRELAPRPGGHILDLCAAPGGKTTFIAQLMSNQGEVTAHEAAPERLKLVEDNCRRLGVTCVKSAVRASAVMRPSTFDSILADVPCSNTGVMRRRVDLRWRIRPGEIERLRAAQLELLRQSAPLLKPGGSLVYSTCSLEPEENQTVIDDFLAGHAGYELAGTRQLIPFQDGVDGAFVAVLKRLPGR